MGRLTFIASAHGTPLTKTIFKGVITPYPNVYEVNSFEAEAPDIQYLYAYLQSYADMGCALLKGELDRPLFCESRAGHSTQTETQLLVLDLDTHEGFGVRDDFLQAMGLDNVSHVFQHSSKSKHDWDIRGHYFFLIDKPTSPAVIKNWLKQKNVEVMGAQIQLTSNDLSLSWPLDIGVNDNGKLIYIAPPILDCPDPVNSRMELNLRPQPTVTIDFSTPTVDIGILISELRRKEGLTPHTTALQGNIMPLKPGQMKVTGYKESGNFLNLNINGGDSWAYYCRLDNPEIVRNFKGEPFYRLKELDSQLYKKYYRPPALGGVTPILVLT